MSQPEKSEFEGCKIESLSNEECRAFLGWVTGGKKPAPNGNGVSWLLAHCHDGVTWGRFDGDNECWRLSSTPFPDLCPAMSEVNLLELRIFGPVSEILIWRADEALKGRQLMDEQKTTPSSPMCPVYEDRILVGNQQIETKDGFTRIRTSAGAEQAVPLECKNDDFKNARWPLRLKVRHYFEQNEKTGAVRISVSRLVNVFKEVQ
jgi:CRISPR-associated protein (TIGR03984 family)